MNEFSREDLDVFEDFAKHISATIFVCEQQNYRNHRRLTEGMEEEERNQHLSHISSASGSSISRICVTRMVKKLYPGTVEIEDPGRNAWHEFRIRNFQIYIPKNDTEPSPRRKRLPVENTLNYQDPDLFEEELGPHRSNSSRPPLYCSLHIKTGFHGMVTRVELSAPTVTDAYPIFFYDFDMGEIEALSQKLLQEHPDIFEPVFCLRDNITPKLQAQTPSSIAPEPMQEVSLDLSEVEPVVEAPLPDNEEGEQKKQS